MRLDVFLTENGRFSSRNKAAEACKRGEVKVDGVSRKSSFDVDGSELIEVSTDNYVSLGAYKLERAKSVFDFDCFNKICVDLGASTGGFTQILLLNGAKKVYAVDVGANQLDQRLLSDVRVVPMDGVNARYLTKDSFSENIDVIVADCSFISLKLILPTVKSLIDKNGFLVCLIKPQFECEGRGLSKTGILTDKKILLNVVIELYNYCLCEGFSVKGFTWAPVNKNKNLEFLIMLDFNGVSLSQTEIETVVYQAERLRTEK